MAPVMKKKAAVVAAILICMSWLLASASALRDMPLPLAMNDFDSLVARLQAEKVGNGGLVECWNALLELKSCTNEIILFFLNGHTDIGADCCAAIDVITHNCWPTMLISLGFTPEEGNILRGYCDAYTPTPTPTPTAAPPPSTSAHPPATLSL